MHAGETSWFRPERDRERLAVADRIPQTAHHSRNARIRCSILSVSQRAVDILTSPEHGREFSDEIGDLLRT
jgi:hypothetical protein